MRKFALIALALITTSPSAAKDYWLIGSVNSGPVFIDADEIALSGGNKTTWALTAYNAEWNSKLKADYAMSFMKFNCQAKTYALASIVVYKLDGSTVVEESAPALHPDEPVVPDSIADAEWKFTCLGDRINSQFIRVGKITTPQLVRLMGNREAATLAPNR